MTLTVLPAFLGLSGFELTRPLWLLALAVVPLLVFLFARSLVDLPRRQLIFSLLVRCGVILLLVLSLAGLNMLESTDEVFVIFALDESLSVDPEARGAARDFISAAVGERSREGFRVLPFARSPGDFATEVGDAAKAAEKAADQSTSPISDTDSATDTDDEMRGTDLQAAIEVAAAGMPPDHVPRLVLLTDGNETHGNAHTAALNAGLKISTVPLRTRDDPEIQLSAVHVPAQVAQGEPFNVEVVVDANHDDQVLVEVYKGEHRIIAVNKPVVEGENRFVFTEQTEEPVEFSARVSRATDEGGDPLPDSFDDTLLDNNRASGLVFASGRPRVLLVETVPELARNLEWALDEEGIVVDTRPPEGMPDSLRDLQNYEVLILSNVPANDLTARQMEVIRAWVSETGGGLIMLGGDQSFGLGGYYKSVVEEVLPVRSDFEKEKEKPGLGMVLIIDKSGSMGGQKIELAKDAARGAVELLGPRDQVGVIAFDGSPYWISEVRSATQKGMVIDRIAGIESGGGTTLYPAMQEAFEALQATSAKLKHVIILTDGHSTPGDFDGITQQMASSRITVSTVGIGNADRDLLERMAGLGNGRYYFAEDPTAVPQIFARETMAASKSAINEEPFIPQPVRSTPVLSGINFDEAPFLLGYVITRPKPTSEVILVTEAGDPLLTWWRYGLGMSVAFTSDAHSRWASEWLTWNGYNTFWAQVVRHCMRKGDSKGFNVDVTRRGSLARITIDAVDSAGRYLNQAETELTVIDPQLESRRIAVDQTGPGRYETEIDVASAGPYHLQLLQKLDGQPVHQQSRGLIVGYPDELRLRPTNTELLQTIARATGGEFDPEPSSVFASDEELASRATPLWPWLLAAAAILFVLDVALRRIDFSIVFGHRVHRARYRGTAG